MSKVLSYNFHKATHCDMCGAKPEDFKVLGRRLNGSQGYKPKKKDGIFVTVKQCTKCKLVFSDPMPVPVRFEDHYEVPAEDYWKNESEDWWQIPEYFVYNRVRWVQHINKLGPGSKMLDIGAGAGQVMKAFELEGFDVMGIEPSKFFHDFIIKKWGIHPDKIKNVGIEEADFEEGTFDFINFSVVLEHIVSPSDALAKAIKWLKPNGVMYVEVPSQNWLYGKFLNIYFKLIGTELVTNLSPMHEPYHLYEFSLESFEKNGKINGYKPAFVMRMGGNHPVPNMFVKLMTKIMLWTKSEMQLAVFLQRTV